MRGCALDLSGFGMIQVAFFVKMIIKLWVANI